MKTDLKERFSMAEKLRSPELWAEARRRATAPEAPPPALEWPPSAARRLAVGALAFAIFVVAVVFAWDLLHPDLVRKPPPAMDQPVDLTAEFGPGWTELPGPPDSLWETSAYAWTGSELLVWGGGGDDFVVDEGFSFDAASRTWRPIPEGPLSPRSLPAFAWTGNELLVWGGQTGECCVASEMFLEDGAAYDPSSRTWRVLAPAPIEARMPFSVWTGSELIVWGSQYRDLRYVNGAAYDPVTDTWRMIADGPIEITDGTAVWTGTEMIVFGAALHGGNVPESETGIGASYDPETNSWRKLPPSIDTNPNANTAVWAGDRLITVDYDSDTEAFDPFAWRWRRLEPMPLDDGEDVPRAAYADGWTFVNFFGQVAAFSSVKENWSDLSDDVPGKDPPSGLPLAAGGAFLLPVRSYELSEEPNVTFDTKLLIWVPPAGSLGEVEEPSPFVPATQTVGDETRMPVVFPDGTEATVVYPTELDLLGLGVQPRVSYLWKDNPPPRFPIVFLHSRDASIAAFVDPEGGSRLINTSDGGIEVLQASGNDTQRLFWIRYELRSWTVLVSVEDALASAVEVNASLRIIETRSGFPMVEASGAIALSHESGEGEGPMLAIGSTLDPSVLLWIERCDWRSGVEEDSESGAYGSACLANGRVTASIYGTGSVVEAIVEGLRVEDFNAA